MRGGESQPARVVEQPKQSGRTTPSYVGLTPASARASNSARGASRKRDTSCELLLRRALWRLGCRFQANRSGLAGRPDIVFSRARLIVFCDGDFWHGKDWEERKVKLLRGTNAEYWIAKIERNMERDRLHTEQLESDGWTVVRVWESDIRQRLDSVIGRILSILDDRGHRRTGT